MGIFEKSIPRYVYNPIQRQPEAVPEYYVDDIFDPILNRNVRTALTQKYGNPLLGTVMGYYEGVENALFGQDDKWGILGPGMGILSGFGRSMDKAGDVILGTLTEGVKGVTGQGFENPLENIFVEDQDYTGRRALAAMANSMRGLAGGTTVSEEDFGGAWGLPSLGIELATDPSILGGNLTKIANSPKLLPQLASAKNGMGKVGKFLQEYDDVMAKASIDLTAPGLRPGIKALRGKLARLIPSNSATKFTDYIKIIQDADPSNPESMEMAKMAQKELLKDSEVRAILETDAKLEELDKRAGYVPERELTTKELLDRVAHYVPQASVVPDVSLDAARGFIKQIKEAAMLDIDSVSKEFAELEKLQGGVKTNLKTYLDSRDVAYRRARNVALHRAQALVKKYGGKVYEDAVKTPSISEVYESIIKELYPGTPADFVATPGIKTAYDGLDEIAAIDPAFKEHIVNNYLSDYFEYDNGALVDKSEGVLNKHYVNDLDFSPNAWRYGTFSENDALNKQITNAIIGKAHRRKLEQYLTISPSEIGKLTPEIVDIGNEYAENVFEQVFRKHIRNGNFPQFSDSTSLKEVLTSKEFEESLKKLIPDKTINGEAVNFDKLRKKTADLLERLWFPPEKLYGKDYTARHRFNDFKNLQEILNGSNVDRELLESRLVTPSVLYSSDMFEEAFTHPWRLVTGRHDDSLSQYLSKTYGSTSVGMLRDLYNYNDHAFDKFFKEYTIGAHSATPLTYEAFVSAFGKTDPKDYSEVAAAIDDFRKQIFEKRTSALHLTAPETTGLFKDLRDALNKFDDDVVSPALMSDGSSYALDDLSLNKTVSGGDSDYDGDAGDVQFAERIAGSNIHGDLVKTEVPVRNAAREKTSSVEDSFFWVLRDLMARNPEVFKNPENLKYVYDPIRPYVQLSVKSPLKSLSEYNAIAGFKKEVLPELKKALANHDVPFRHDNAFAKKYPNLYKHIGNNETRSQDYFDILNYIKRGFGGDGFKGTTHELMYHNFYINNADVVDAFAAFPKHYDASEVANAIRGYYEDFYSKKLNEGMSLFEIESEFAKTNVGKLSNILATWDNKFLGSIDEAALDSDALIAHLQSRSFRQSKKEFGLATERARIGSLMYGPYNHTGGVFGSVGNVSKEIAQVPRVPASQKFSATADAATTVIINAPAKEAAELITNPPTAASTAAERLLDPAVQAAILSVKGAKRPKKTWHWFEQIRKAIATPLRAIGLEIDEKTGERIGRASLRTKRAEEVMSRARTLISEDGVSQGEVRRVLGLLTAQQGDILKGTEFVDEICKEGMVRSAFRTKAAAGAASKTLQANVNTFNAAVGKDVLQLLERKMSNGNYEVIVTFNTKNKKLVNQIAATKKKLDGAAFMDTEFLKAHTLTTEQAEFLRSEKAQKIISYLEEVDGIAKDQARTLGFTFDDTAIHTKHVRDVNPETADYIANDLNNGIDLDALEEATTLLSNTDAFRAQYKGALGARLRGRRYRGAYWNYDTSKASLFTYDLEKFAKGSLSDGMFANSNYQSFVDLFVNDNFKVKDVFEDVDDFRKFMYQGGAEGKYAGNLKNIDLCYAKYDADGRFIGIHKYNVYSDADLEKALANPDTILVPANVVDTLDKVIRKEIRLSNKAYAFINKHFTIPFKFGVLTNPGFLLGNVSDAYMKQAVTMSEKYGTSVSEELAKVGEAATMYLNLGNKFNAAVEKWQADMRKLGFELTAAEEVPEILAGHAASRQRLTEYVKGSLVGPDGNLVQSMLTDDESGVILLWTKLQQLQHTSNSLREFDDVADAMGKSEFDVPRSIVDRITQGSGKYSWKKPSTWGVFINNPVANSAMNASEFIENTMRGTAVLNDLMHEGYSNEDIFRILLDGSKSTEAAATKLAFDVDFADAINAMYEANFNYERMSDFMEGVGKAMPFPTFFLKNLTYWLNLFEKNPQFFDHAITVHENMWADRDTSEDEFLAEAKGRGAVPVGGQKLSNFFKGIYKPTPLQSMFGAFNLVNEPIENLSYRLHPLISGSAETVNQMLPHSPLTTFLGESKYRPYSTDVYERNIKQGDENFNPLAYAVHRSNPFERTINTALRTPKKVATGQAQLSDFLPSVFQPDFSKK